jgi:hypothetical protein
MVRAFEQIAEPRFLCVMQPARRAARAALVHLVQQHLPHLGRVRVQRRQRSGRERARADHERGEVRVRSKLLALVVGVAALSACERVRGWLGPDKLSDSEALYIVKEEDICTEAREAGNNEALLATRDALVSLSGDELSRLSPTVGEPRSLPVPGFPWRKLVFGEDPRWVGLSDGLAGYETMRVFDRVTRTLAAPTPFAAGDQYIDGSGAPHRLPGKSSRAGLLLPGGKFALQQETLRELASGASFELRAASPLVGALVDSLLGRSHVTAFDPANGSVELSDDSGRRFRLLGGHETTELSLRGPRGLVAVKAPPAAASARRQPAVISDDARFAAILDGASARVWTTAGRYLSEALPHPSPILDARFVTRDTATYLQTICADGIRDWFVFEDFAAKPAWVIQLARLNYGLALADDGTERPVPGYTAGPTRQALLRQLALSTSPAARAARRHYGLE